jgi:hypothetical protein
MPVDTETQLQQEAEGIVLGKALSFGSVSCEANLNWPHGIPTLQAAGQIDLMRSRVSNKVWRLVC